MKASKFLILLALPFLFACSPLKPEIFTIAVPAAPLVHELERHRQSFSSLKGIARIVVEKQGWKRSFDTVGIVVDDQHRFRIEAYGPLGQSLMEVVWNGKDVLVLMRDEEKVVRTESAGIQDLLGQGLEPSELCAVLSGNIPVFDAAIAPSQQYCNREGVCILELRDNDIVRRLKVAYSTKSGSTARNPQILTYELSRSGKLLFQTQFDRVEDISGYLFPTHIVIEKPDKNLLLKVMYDDVDLNSPVDDEAFTLSGPIEDNSGK